MGREAERELKKAGTFSSHYQGPTTITTLINHQAAELGIETIRFIVSLPQYVELEEDYTGKVRLMEVLNLLYNMFVRMVTNWILREGSVTHFRVAVDFKVTRQIAVLAGLRP